MLPLLLPLSLYRDPRFHGYYVRVPLRISVLATTIFHFIPKPSSLHSVQRVTEIRTLNILPVASPCAEKLRQSDSRKRFRNDGKILNWKIGSSRFAGDVIQIQISLGRRSVGSVYISNRTRDKSRIPVYTSPNFLFSSYSFFYTFLYVEINSDARSMVS